MKINCLHCGHAFGVDDSYCDYEGLLKCPTCAGLLEARIQDGMVRSVRPGSFAAPPAEPAPAPATQAQALSPASVQAQVQAATQEIREVQAVTQQAIQPTQSGEPTAPQPIDPEPADQAQLSEGPGVG